MQRESTNSELANLHEWVVSEQPTAEDAVALADEVENVLRSLPPQHRRVVELRLQGELLTDIARDISLSERTVRRILAELEAQLRQKHGQVESETIRVISCLQEESLVPSTEKTKSVPETLRCISFDDLTLKKLIGTGGMGKIYRAVWKTTGRDIAVKFLHKSLRDSPSIVERFQTEAATIQQLDHPGLVQVQGIGQTKAGVWFIVMNLIEGRCLADELAIRIPSIDQALQWIVQIAEALSVVHTAGIVHCDLKPANVLLTPEGKVVITDFGLARQRTESRFSRTAVAGSAPWMSPEQIDPVFGPIDHRTDIYGLGAVLYTLLTSQPPFNATRIPDVLSQIVSQQPVPPSQLRSGVSTRIEELCLHCLQKFPECRIQSIEEFIRSALRWDTEA